VVCVCECGVCVCECGCGCVCEWGCVWVGGGGVGGGGGGGRRGYVYVCGVNDVFMSAECGMSRTEDRYLEAGEIPTETWL